LDRRHATAVGVALDGGRQSMRPRSTNREDYMVLSRVARPVRVFRVASIAGAKTAIDAVLNRPQACLSFEWLGDERYYVYLLTALTRIGAVGCPARAAHRAREWLSRSDFAQIRLNWRNPSYGFLLSDRKNGKDIIHINRQYYSSPLEKSRIFAPYFAHPEFYKAGLHNIVSGMRQRERNIRIFFAGTISIRAYSEKFMFPILTRDKVLSHVFNMFRGSIKTELIEPESRPIIIVSTTDTRDLVAKHKLSLGEYIETMSRAHFFICPPGWLMPHSHNLIEAMSVGTIPITNYHSYMRPSLTPGTNCLAFSTVEKLEEIIDHALRMPVEEIQHLRQGVISYYEKYLEPESFGKRLMECLPAISELVVNDESGR
jgi:hypothetical protein